MSLTSKTKKINLLIDLLTALPQLESKQQRHRNEEPGQMKETDKQKQERKEHNEKIIKSYGLYKPKLGVLTNVSQPKKSDEFNYVFYVDFKAKVCYARQKEPRIYRGFI